jgi:hypothetical protein
MKLLYFAGALLFLGGTLAQNCADDFIEGINCMGPAFEPIVEKLPPPPTEEQMAQKKQKFLACFTDNGCNNPMEVMPEMSAEDMEIPPEMREIVDKLQSVGIVGLDIEKIKKMMSVSVKCGEKLKDDIEPLMSKCVASKIPLLEGFKLPDNHPLKEHIKKMGPSLTEAIHGMDGILPLFGMFGKMAATIQKHGVMAAKAAFSEKVCDSKDKTKKAAECIAKLFDEKIPEEMKCKNPAEMAFHILETKDNLCTQRAQCEAKANPQCVEAIKSIPKALCSCGAALMSSKWDELVDKMATCVSQETGEQLNIPPPVAAGLKQMLGGKMREACSADPEQMDPCSEDFCPIGYMMDKMMEEHKGKGPRGHGPPRPGGHGPPPFGRPPRRH